MDIEIPTRPKVDLPTCYSLAQLAEWSGQTEQFWALQVKRGKLKAQRVGRNIRVLHPELEAYLERSRREAEDSRAASASA